MKIFLFITFLFCSSILSFGQNIWTATTTSDATSEGMDVVIDPQGNSYMIGYISGDTEFQDIQIDINMGYSDVVVAKINPNGVYQWVKRFNGPLSDKGTKIALTSNNELVITGTFYNTITFGSTVLTATAQSKDIFLARLDNDGNVLWARKEGGGLGDNVYGLTIDNSDNIILTGQFEGTSTIGNQTFTSMEDPDLHVPSFDMFLAKYDGSGNPLWSKVAYAEYEDRGLAVACDAQNNIYLSGQFSDTIDFFGQTIYNQIYNVGFVSKFTPSGAFSWFDKLAGAQVLAYDLCVNSQNQVVVTGDYLGQLVVWAQENQHVITNPYDRKIFVLKLAASGNYVWGKAVGSNSEVSSRTVCTDSQDNIYIGGHFKCNFDEYRDSTGTSHWQSAGFKDIYVSKFSSSGNKIWGKQASGQKEESCWGIDIQEDDNPVITGSYNTNLYFPFDYNSTLNITNIDVQEYEPNYSYCSSYLNVVALAGDESINLFVAKALSGYSALNNFYYNTFADSVYSYQDSIPMNIYPKLDTADFCKYNSTSPYARLFTNTCLYFGPLYGGIWNSGIPYNSEVDYDFNDGLYIVDVYRLDQCSSFSDSIYIRYHDRPEIPYMTDNHGVNDTTNNYISFEVCSPDTLNFWFSNLTPNNTYSLYNYLDTVPTNIPLNDTIFSITESRSFDLIVTSEFGCISDEPFMYKQQVPFDSIELHLEMFSLQNYPQLDDNDSVQICRGNPFAIVALDSISNPGSDVVEFPNPKANFHWNVVSENNTFTFGPISGYSIDSIGLFVWPENSGWYTISYHVDLGYPGLSCYDTIGFNAVDSFYVKIVEPPHVEIFGDQIFCPDQYNYLSITDSLLNVLWLSYDLSWSNQSNQNILWQSSDSDSIKVNESGVYQVIGYYQFEEVQCSVSDTILILEKQPPLVYSNPIDGIVCPGDSINLWINQHGLFYEWIGPEGFPVSFDSSIFAVNQGFYACIFTDMDGCQLLTAQTEIKQYTTPFLDLSPTSVICENEDIVILAMYGGDVTIQWYAPLSGSQDEVIVNQAGTYACSITQCGMTVIDSVVITDGSFDLVLTAPTTVLCEPDSIRLDATPGLASYQWSNEPIGFYFQYVDEPGSYSVEAWNEYGCHDLSDTIHLTVVPESYAPLVSDTVICQGEDVTLQYNSPYPFQWYTSENPGSAFSSSGSISFTDLMADTTVFIAHNNTTCPLNFTEVNINVLTPVQTPIISGDTTICVGTDAVFSVPLIDHGTYQWTYNGTVISNDAQVQIPDLNQNSSLSIEILVSDLCTSASNTFIFELRYPSPITLNLLGDTLCYGEALSLTAAGTGNTAYYWTDGTQNWSQNPLNLSYAEANSGIYSVYGVNADDCQSETLNAIIVKAPEDSLVLAQSGLSCLGSSVVLSATNNDNNLSWTLPNGEQIIDLAITLDSLSKQDNGSYIASYTNAFACLVADTITLSANMLPTFVLANDSVLCSSDAYDLLLPDLPYDFVWGNGSMDSIYTPTGGEITLTATDGFGCSYTDTVNIVLVDCSGQAANVITTNNDGINEYFVVQNSEYDYDNCLVIFNRWGNVVYEASYYRNGFNGYDDKGRKLNAGVYFYLYYSNCSDKKEITHQGYFHIITE